MKPKMFKLGGAWVWRCEHPKGSQVGDVFVVGSWRNPWDACMGAVVKHAMLYHSDAEPVEEIDLLGGSQ